MTPGKPARRRERLWLEEEEERARAARPASGSPRARPRRARADRLSRDARYVIDLCDEIVGEPGWREHRFRWLAAEGNGHARTLPVDAYYPGIGLVVHYRDGRGRGDELDEQVIAAHGLAMVFVTPEALRRNGPGRIRHRPDRDREILAQLVKSAAAASRGSASRRAEAAGPVSRSWQLQIAGLALALVGCGALLLAGLTGGPQFWLNVGGALLAFGLAYDVYARVLGALAARAHGERGWQWACAIGGSPVVAAHALLRRAGPSRPELDTLLSLVVLTAVLALLVASLTGIGDSA